MRTQGGKVRLEETEAEVERARADVMGWLTSWDIRDSKQHAHSTQLSSLRRSFAQVFGRLFDDVGDVATIVDDDGTIYHRCREADIRTAHVRRLWRWFADRFDQRIGDDHGLLAAADEVTWSCYAQAFVDDSGVPAPPSAPLPYIDPRLAPQAIARDLPPLDLRLVDSMLQQNLRLLPVPGIALPPVCAVRPWWLVLLAHECGHHIQHDLPNGVVAEFAALVAETTSNTAGAIAVDVDRWRGWSEELFADASAVLLMGTAARWAMSELEHDTPPSLATSSDPRYPPPLIRCRFMDAVLDLHACAPGSAATDVPASIDEQLADAMAQAVVDRAIGGQTLADRLGFDSRDFDSGGPVDEWRYDLLGAEQVRGERTLIGARRCLAGGVAAWAEIAQSSDCKRRVQQAELSARLIEALSLCQAPGLRAAQPRAASSALADAIFALPADSLVASIERPW